MLNRKTKNGNAYVNIAEDRPEAVPVDDDDMTGNCLNFGIRSGRCSDDGQSRNPS